MKKRFLSLLCVLALCLSLLPTTAMAADHWAADAVDTLSTIYGSGVFSADDGTMTVEDLNTLMEKTGWKTDKAGSDTTTPLSRGTACEVLADVFDLPIGSKSAIRYLYEQNIINDTVDGLNETGSVTEAEFAVLTYRVLNSVGGGMGSSTALKPGTEAYFAWMYLAVRKCVPVEITADELQKTMDESTLTTLVWDEDQGKWVDAPKAGKELWDAWAARLDSLSENEGSFAPEYDEHVAENTTLLEAAKTMVNEYIKADGTEIIFSDVQPDDWHYDGIMYLANQNIVIGYGDGQFGPDNTLPRYELALLLSIMDGTVSSTGTNSERITTATTNVRVNDYLPVPESADDNDPFNDPYWSQLTTREEAVVGILAMITKTYNIGEINDNTAILDRFTDKNQISNQHFEPFLAYAVSMGLLSGTSELSPQASVSRAQVGVLAYRTRIGLDSSKMKDYKDNVTYVLPVSGSAAGEDVAEGGSAATSPVAAWPMARTGQNVTLTLREDWRLTSNLDLRVPADTTLTIDGQSKYHIYEMDGKLLNSGGGTVTFAEGTAFYPTADDEDAKSIIPEGIWDAKESNALMVLRAKKEGDIYYTVALEQTSNGTITVDKLVAKQGEEVTVTAKPDSGYGAETLTVRHNISDGSSTASSYLFYGSSLCSFPMPNSNATIQVEFKKKPDAPIFSPAGGTYSSPQSVTISNTQTEGTTVYYTTDGTNPTKDSLPYSGPITISSTTTLKAVAVNGDIYSDITTATYTINTGGGGSTGGGSTGGGSSDPTYSITLPGRVTGGELKLSRRYAEKGETVTVTAIPDEGYELDTLMVTDSKGKEIELTHKGGNEYTFKMPAGRVEIEVSFREITVELPFTDVPEGAWYADAAAYVYEHGLMAGTSATTFAPDATTSRSMIATILWRMAGSPVVNYAMDFADVPEGQWYSEAVRWAASEGVVTGYGNGLFGTNDPITREQFAAMLYRFAQEQGYDVSIGENTNILSYTDVADLSEYAISAMQWAVGAGIINGTGDGSTLSPQSQATRAQAAVMLMRFCENYVIW